MKVWIALSLIAALSCSLMACNGEFGYSTAQAGQQHQR